MSTKTKRSNGAPYAGYPRVSQIGKRDVDHLVSPEQQTDAICGFANAHKLPVRMYEAELDVSGSKPKRVVLDAIIEGVERGELAGVIVAKLDRLSRLSPKDRMELFDRIERAGGVVLSATESNDTSTPEGRWVREIFLGLARMQWEKYREGWENSKRGAIEKGHHIGVHAPFGYRKETDKASPNYRKLVPDPIEAPIMRELFERRAAGETTPSLAKWLNSHGVKTRHGSVWLHHKIAALISNRVYLGEVFYGSRRTNPDEVYVNPTAHEPLVDVGTWNAAQKPHPRGGAGRPTRTPLAWLLKGMVRCAACGYVMPGNRRPGKVSVYFCTGRNSAGKCPAPARVPAEALEAEVLKQFWTIAAAMEAESSAEVDTTREEELEAEVERWARSVEDWRSPDTQEAVGDMAAWRAGMTKRNAEHDRAAQALAVHRAEREHHAGATVKPVAVLREEWEGYSLAERCHLLGTRIDCVAVTRDRTVEVFRRGHGPTTLPRNGRRNPTLMPINVPSGAGVLAA